MDWVTALPSGGDRSFNACIVLVGSYSKTSIFLPCHEDDTAMAMAIMIWNRVISHTGLFQNILSFSTAYHPQTDGLAGRTIQTLEDMIRRLFSYGIEFKYSDCFTHDWFTLITAIELAYKTSIHSSTGKTQEILEKGWNLRLPYATLKKGLSGYTSNSKQFQNYA
ncbi:hypothetical protein O181_065374 [Austropuccinia psidii MF-1]|uniref:Integrase catalytic domain-containing protein n=1 Tax=Austropuccinia psidii MF-1 TaxID=1389203 RepID=A0A9Q3EQY0_9BASI|nr:hypothetical protein [Austropuccinia psidii MF-1]